jgi:hypothetical protein
MFTLTRYYLAAVAYIQSWLKALKNMAAVFPSLVTKETGISD